MVRVTVGTHVGHKACVIVVVSVRGIFQGRIGEKVTNATAE
jgi:hypothetical protein